MSVRNFLCFSPVSSPSHSNYNLSGPKTNKTFSSKCPTKPDNFMQTLLDKFNKRYCIIVTELEEIKSEIMNCIHIYNKKLSDNNNNTNNAEKTKRKNKLTLRNKVHSPGRTSSERLMSSEHYKKASSVYNTYNTNTHSNLNLISTCTNIGFNTCTAKPKSSKQSSMNDSLQNMFRKKSKNLGLDKPQHTQNNIYYQVQKVQGKGKQGSAVKNIKNNILVKQDSCKNNKINHNENLNKAMVHVIKSGFLNNYEMFKFAYLNKKIYYKISLNIMQNEDGLYTSILKYPSNSTKMSINFITNDIEKNLYCSNDKNKFNFYTLWLLLTNNKSITMNTNNNDSNLQDLYNKLYQQCNVSNLKELLTKIIINNLYPVSKYIKHKHSYTLENIQKISQLIEQIKQNNKVQVGENTIYNYLYSFLKEINDVMEFISNPLKIIVLKNK